MIKLTFCLARRPEMTREAFQDYWRTHHAPKVMAAKEALGIKRYVQCHSYMMPMAEAAAQARGMAIGDNVHDFDGVAELWWENREAFEAAMTTEEGQRHGKILAEDEATFIDFIRSRFFMVEENVVIGD